MAVTMTRKSLAPVKKKPSTAIGKLHGIYFTKKEQLILSILSDGKAHVVSDFKDIVHPKANLKNVLKVHMAHIRTKLIGTRHTIVCIYRGKQKPVRYMHIITLC